MCFLSKSANLLSSLRRWNMLHMTLPCRVSREEPKTSHDWDGAIQEEGAWEGIRLIYNKMLFKGCSWGEKNYSTVRSSHTQIKFKQKNEDSENGVSNKINTKGKSALQPVCFTACCCEANICVAFCPSCQDPECSQKHMIRPRSRASKENSLQTALCCGKWGLWSSPLTHSGP